MKHSKINTSFSSLKFYCDQNFAQGKQGHCFSFMFTLTVGKRLKVKSIVDKESIKTWDMIFFSLDGWADIFLKEEKTFENGGAIKWEQSTHDQKM